MKVIKISKILSKDLVLRDSANKLFQIIEQSPEKLVKIDFSGVSSMTMSFAHEYLSLIKKMSTEKSIVESNVPINIKKLFEIVKIPISRPKLVNFGLIQPIPI